ncbi:LAMI_0C04830g1_1 [Lachancea mirantina]|uniref:LAMI_0C04830g1_1 n=1 Tax=Lachancea mirantina TaxID=1230905 RepID=A0A1G4J2C8_9SACH|nr:LAMI_0C04830g1_1 [Lachancea mirantina]
MSRLNKSVPGQFKPMNTLSSGSALKSSGSRSSSSTGYTKERFDPQAASKVRKLGETMASLSSNNKWHHSESPMTRNRSSRDDIEIVGVDPNTREESIKEVIKLEGTSERDLFQGDLYIFFENHDRLMKRHAVLQVARVDGDLRTSVKRNSQEIEGTAIHFLTEGKSFAFDLNYKGMFVDLKHARIVRFSAEEQISGVIGIAFKHNSGRDSYREKFKEYAELLQNSFLDVYHITGEINEHTAMSITKRNHTESKAHRDLKDRRFNSLRKLHKSISRTGNKIQVPQGVDQINDKEEIRQENPSSNVTSPAKFYGRSQRHMTRSSVNSLQDHKLSRLETLTRSSRSSPVRDISSAEEEPCSSDPYETPENFEPPLFYKFQDGFFMSITNQDFGTLFNHDWINDSILDFFTKFWVEDSINKGVINKDDVYVFSSFFYTKLVSDPKNYYNNICKWVSGTDLFAKSYLVLPINANFHWFGSIITNLPAVFKFLREEQKLSGSLDNEKGTKFENSDEISITPPSVTLLVFDSLRQNQSRAVEPIKEFLIAYAADRYNLEIPKNLIKMKTCLVPQQPNMSDCGVHVILNTKKFFEDPFATLELWKMSKSKANSRQINEYFDRRGRVTARKELREILLQLQHIQIKSHGAQSPYFKETNDEQHSDVEIIENLEFIGPQQKMSNVSGEDNQADHSQPSLYVDTKGILPNEEPGQIGKLEASKSTQIGLSYEISSEPLQNDEDGLSKEPNLRPSKLAASARNRLESSPLSNNEFSGLN